MPVANEELLIYEAMEIREQRSIIHMVDAETGRELHRVKTTDIGSALWMSLSDQGLLLAATPRQLVAIDPYTGKGVWQETTALHNLRASLTLGPEALFLSQNGETLVRRSLETGKVEAESPILPGTASAAISLVDHNRLFAKTREAVMSLDAHTLKPLWRGTTDAGPNLVDFQVGQEYVVAVSQQQPEHPDRPGKRFVAYFYERRDDSGLIAPDGGMVDLGHYDSARNVHFGDHTLLIVDGLTVHGWVGSGRTVAQATPHTR